MEVWFEKENIWTFQARGELLVTILSSLAQEESRSISENVKWGKRKSFADGKVCVPFTHLLAYGGFYGDIQRALGVPTNILTTEQLKDNFLQAIRKDEVLLYEKR